jgi:hypothetical protein
MAYTKKYVKGNRIDSITTIVRSVKAGRYIFWGDTPKHSSVIASMTLRTVLNAMSLGILFTAKENTNVK